jgi:predicted DNA-binding protein
MTKPLRIRLPDDLRTRLDNLSTTLTQRAGGVEQDFSKVIRHVLIKGLEAIEKETADDR